MTYISWFQDFAFYHCHRLKIFVYIKKWGWPGVFVPLQALALVHPIISSFFWLSNFTDLSFSSDSAIVGLQSDPLTPGAVARSEACPLGKQAAPNLIPTSGTFFHGDLVMKQFLWPFSLFRWFKKSSCQLLAKECALSTSKLPRRLAQEQCG